MVAKRRGQTLHKRAPDGKRAREKSLTSRGTVKSKPWRGAVTPAPRPGASRNRTSPWADTGLNRSPACTPRLHPGAHAQGFTRASKGPPLLPRDGVSTWAVGFAPVSQEAPRGGPAWSAAGVEGGVGGGCGEVGPRTGSAARPPPRHCPRGCSCSGGDARSPRRALCPGLRRLPHPARALGRARPTGTLTAFFPRVSLQ